MGIMIFAIIIAILFIGFMGLYIILQIYDDIKELINFNN